ncbi:MAG: indole-3-glycerol phosphate synthase TrpC [Deltaproteobacteria bacterium]|nr:indole-3-glycerol phosphate synthase TrpC [Deltaproteobacteria bacterium]
MHSRLKEILAEKQREIVRLKKGAMSAGWDHEAFVMRDFKEAISVPDKVGLIAEIKFASPSVGIIRERINPVSIGRIYEGSGAAAISLVTERSFFKGDICYLPSLKQELHLPLLRKDFLLDPIQVKESFLHGADAVLLIARILSAGQLSELLSACQEFGLAPLTEIHDREDLEKALACGAQIIGINNRDLNTFEVDLKTTLDLAPLIPESCVTISESGIHSREDIGSLKRRSINAVLVGTSLMKSHNIGAKTSELADKGKMHGAG